MNAPSLPTPRRARIACLFAGATALGCAALLGAAVLVPAPAVALPMILAACIGLPMAAATELPISIAVLRATRDAAALTQRHLSDLRRDLDRLPETRHPLDL